MINSLEYQTKNWGKTACLGVYNDVMVWQAFVEKGHKCSVHHHEQDYNEIIVVNGMLRIHFYENPPKTEAESFIDLTPGSRVTIPPMKVHQFEVLEDGVIMELYWRDHNFDIVRHND